ncbi:glycosyltransferase [Halalkalibacter akibai]|uniref:Glycosyltransferase n=1 Tax=Halalkalibacter akibai (strain ATCC 43226 / DSM 21942 / CIP 109018 / JCM 9157 / 1139) TaxID=1236973 RepID=W4QVX4_HALA3|nr:glycosyltransferase [Halalkalibacter akibai]GAE35788.1 glycosyltransferase [Halalkalibacter akibai JCM 9157]
MHDEFKSKQSIFFSVLLVVRNEEKYISRLIETLLKQEFPIENYELIIIDGCSSDNTLGIVEDYRKKYPDFIRVYNNNKKTLPAGWNIGIKQSKGQYVLRLDGHTEVPNDFLLNNWETIKKQPEATCVGGIIISKGHGFQGSINEYVYSHPFGVGSSKFRTLNEDWEGFVETVPYGAYKKEIFDEIGCFNEDLKRNEDIEFHRRVYNYGGQFFLSTKIRSTYYVRDSLKGLINKSLGDGTWSMIANQVTPGSLSVYKKAPLYTFLSGVALFIGAFLHSVFFWLFMLALLSYTLLNSIVSIKFARKKGIQFFLPCFIAFFCMHFFRGLGSFLAYFKMEYWIYKKQLLFKKTN